TKFALNQNYPNPFSTSTTISFVISHRGTENTEINIYNIKGQKIKTFSNLQINKSPNQQIIWDGKDENGKPVSSGIYFYKLNIKNSPIKKMLLLR
ncbi:MAG: T9SS type A sorting domain-containing protein, partial [Candidatus Cloacimonetes bacterium]|nr:T9SS type A sorting domain-containing protein [Candidatus Cloacimonadota bacterium]